MSGQLNGCVVIVTGASRGIGKAITARLAAEGARLVITGGPDDAELLEAAAKLAGGEIETVTGEPYSTSV